ncbi:hypothetical protein R0131_14965 [Clostridium sp. AL.422]|uniref:hypothetical protein n=1 Tax=Clostridium TaxID=1485 RepID=UPI00293DBED3|nr:MULTISPECIES: hypothetical protein [unclassified Clostridium]MDV4152127.1 hypothetical protein [Clostridium sp. AL.422]
MRNYKENKYTKVIKQEIKDKVDSLIAKNKILKKYEKSQVLVSTISIVGTIIYCFLTNKNNSLNEIWSRYEFYAALIFVLIYNAIIEKRVKSLKKEVDKGTETIKNKMILRICNCDYNCYCREELNEYMKDNGIKII